MIQITLVRHGMTEGNRLHRYIGRRSDEPLCKEGLCALQAREPLKQPDLLFVSPMLRCRQTASVYYPNIPQIIISDFEEMDFGIFENQSYEEHLKDSAEYQRWVDSRCELPIPGGESREEFLRRCMKGFSLLLEHPDFQEKAASGEDFHIAIVAHGGTIMSLMDQLTDSDKRYFDWYAGNGGGYEGEWKDGKLLHICKL